MLELYRNIKKYRKLNNTTQLELAEAIGYSDRSIISKIENGGIDLTQSQIIKFADVFGISPGTLMGNDGTLDHMDQLDPEEQRVLARYRELSDAEKDMLCRSLGIRREK